MTDDELIRLARAQRVQTRYRDWRGRGTDVPRDTIVAVLTALGLDVSTPAAVRAELRGLDEEWRGRLLPPVVVYPPGPVWEADELGRPVAKTRPLRMPVADEVWVELGGGGTVPVPHRAGPPVRRRRRGAGGREVGRREEEYFLSGDIPEGWHRLHARRGDRHETAALLVNAPIADRPRRRVWGLLAQLYSVRSRASWGMGDLGDLAELAARGRADLGAEFVVVNPLHAAEPVPPIAASPYSPVSRCYAAPLYLRVEDVPEFRALGAADRDRIAALAAPHRAATRSLDPVDRDAVWRAKLPALELLYRQPRTAARQASYDAFRGREGAALIAFATWCALAEEHGADWRRWPAELQDTLGPGVPAARRRLAGRVGFHCWLQWQLDGQLAAAQLAARRAGMAVGIVHDLPVGVSHGGADAWAYRPLFAPGMSVGAPPDEFNQRGQDWGQPPWHPERLADAEYGPYRRMLAAALRHAGGLRLDHAMQMSRLWWIPEGASPAEGTYVGYDRPTMLAVLAGEARRRGALIIGEDLGTVEPGFRADLADKDILGTSLLWFERDGRGRPRPPERWRALSLATVGTHDMPPIAGYLHGDHIELRERLGLLTRPASRERAGHRRQLRAWLALLYELGLLGVPPEAVLSGGSGGSGGSGEHDGEVVAALHGFLALTPAALVGISLADAVGERRTQNQPGTIDEYPNWRVPLADAAGRPVLLEDLFGHPAVLAAVAPVRRLIGGR